MDSLSWSLQSLDVNSTVTASPAARDEASAAMCGRTVAEVKDLSLACSGFWSEDVHWLPDVVPGPSATVVTYYCPGLFMGNPVNDEKASPHPCHDKVVSVMSAFGTHHPFDSSTLMQNIYKAICDEEKQLSPLISNGQRCNYLFSAFLAFQYSGVPDDSNPVLAKFQTIDTDFLDLYLRTVELYLAISRQPPPCNGL
ncbi:hypothetical protein [Endozoicomonas sp. SESOKO1]|uniref:hypothetical protein n=1 Tax=Endozoicomonas sp. SESOKO1 TaxID=2828742 RepID=UPI0021496758|nr:hypothetical protein [Endozoicomonas sp. SESOKO1]